MTTCSSASRDLVQSLGADEILDYKERPLVEQLKEKYRSDPFDIIFDTATGDADLYHQSPHYLKVSTKRFRERAPFSFAVSFTSVTILTRVLEIIRKRASLSTSSALNTT